MPVIGNWQKRVRYASTEAKLSELACGWHPFVVLGKVLQYVYKSLGKPEFKLPGNPVFELKDLSPKIIIKDRNDPKDIRRQAYARFYAVVSTVSA
jgi:hypothetical protein